MSTKITYNGKTTELADGYIATLSCKDLKMETDVVVEAPEPAESVGSSINVQPLNATANGTYDAPEGQAYDPVTVDVKPITEPITITENGFYPVPKGSGLEFGKEYKFKDAITAEEFDTYIAGSNGGEDAGGMRAYALCDAVELIVMPADATTNVYMLTVLTNGAENAISYVLGGSAFGLADGWQLADKTPTNAPTITVADHAKMSADLATTAVFFDIETKSLDGWGDITVNVAPLPIEVSTEAEMTALLTSGEVGGVYKYTGTTGTYENGALYVLEAELGTFTYAQSSAWYSTPIAREFPLGMTWAEFISSEYNAIAQDGQGDYAVVGQFIIRDDGQVMFSGAKVDGTIALTLAVYYDLSTTLVYGADVILDEGIYDSAANSGGGGSN